MEVNIKKKLFSKKEKNLQAHFSSEKEKHRISILHVK
jgi:hypothetical protein